MNYPAFNSRIRHLYRRLFDASVGGSRYFLARWIFLRALALIYFSAFFSLCFQIRGLIGPRGILPADEYLSRVATGAGLLRYWYAPTLLWLSSGSHLLMALCWCGMAAAGLAVFNVWPRFNFLVCFVCFVSFVAAAQDFSGYQSDGMLLEAGFLALFFAPGGFLPGLGLRSPGVAASRLLLLWEWFRIYFESGLVKLKSGDPTWRNLTAMYDYYQNGPLPTWIGWYLQHWPHWFQKATAFTTLVMELAIVFLAFLPRPYRIACFWTVTIWQVGVISTANYAFLNYLVLVLGFLLLDDQAWSRIIPRRWRPSLNLPAQLGELRPRESSVGGLGRSAHSAGVAVTALVLCWIFYAGTLPLVQMFWRSAPLPEGPATALQPFRIANQYGLFAVMTPARYEIEFQGSDDGVHWKPYPFRYKPQNPGVAPGIYAPYQPRFDWNLWFASLGNWAENPMVLRTEELLLMGDPAVLELFADDPFPQNPPKYVRAVLWQYWFSTPEEKRTEHIWWTRRLLGAYAPAVERLPNGRIGALGGNEQ